uniref:Uncharacterized protein n=1 Tax=Populus alba TaxID=43335 RepID=A0A4U5MHK4_POPAL|nr:hypothetical protein D5086_0000307270 [Populus alba]
MFDVLFVNGKILRRDNLKDYHLNLIYVKLWLRGNRREFIDALPNGWEDYAWRRINKGVLLNRCENKTYAWRNFRDLLKTKFGKEIDDYDVVIRENGVPVENYTEFVGKKSSFHLLNRGSAKALDKVVELDETRKELSNEKSERPFSSAFLAGLEHLLDQQLGTGLEAPEFALSICESVDMHGFTVKPGYKEWYKNVFNSYILQTAWGAVIAGDLRRNGGNGGYWAFSLVRRRGAWLLVRKMSDGGEAAASRSLVGDEKWVVMLFRNGGERGW